MPYYEENSIEEKRETDEKYLLKQEKIQKKIEAQRNALENLYGESFKRINLNELEEICPKFMELVRKYFRPFPARDGYDKKYLTYEITRKNNDKLYVFELFTSLNKYRFTINPIDNTTRCFVRARKQVVGESWNRCFDLPEGEINNDLFIKVLAAIVEFETVLIGSL